MYKISRMNAFTSIAKALRLGENEKANQMLNIVFTSLEYEKKHKVSSDMLTLFTKEEKDLFEYFSN